MKNRISLWVTGICHPFSFSCKRKFKPLWEDSKYNCAGYSWTYCFRDRASETRLLPQIACFKCNWNVSRKIIGRNEEKETLEQQRKWKESETPPLIMGRKRIVTIGDNEQGRNAAKHALKSQKIHNLKPICHFTQRWQRVSFQKTHKG